MWHSPKGVIQRKGLTDEKAARLLEGFRAGSTLKPFAVKSTRFKAYCDAHPGYALVALPLLETNNKAANWRKGEAKRNRTHCKRGHPLNDATVYLDRGGSHRKCMLCTAINEKNPPLPTADQVSRVTAALNAGKTIGEICWGIVDGKKVAHPILIHRKLKRYRDENPDYDRFVSSVISGSGSRARQRRLLQPQKLQVIAARSQHNDYHSIVAMVPSYLPPDVRDDVAQSIMLALLEGTLRRDQLKARVGEFVRLHHREANKVGVGKFGLRSLDAPAFTDGSKTLADFETRSIWDEVPM
ncbi:hypothetical protein H8B02_17720 [Bradyrhizobium sp. Pear77]|uniref:hypothetical protein n=1 Tax=Bradyrhizobium altum TaxID=1571202 RepID=UPI001E33DDA4|nr:hypothetical protein [Bradyrhizobium altum]MCC8955206.1 hypothetical protein [Bradyrhizobium altum]